MSELQRETTESSIRLIQAMVADLRYQTARLETHPEEAGEAVLSLGSTLSEAIKKLSAVIGNDPEPKKMERHKEKVSMKAITNFNNFAESL